MSLVFPVGHYVGERHPERHHVVRRGTRHHRLTADEFGVWILAHGTADVGKGAWTVDALLDLAESAALPDARLTVAGLAGAGLVATVDGPADARRFAERHRVHPLLTGIGNTEDQPDRYLIGIPGMPPTAVVDVDTYELWQWGHVSPTLWQSCEVREKVAAELGEQATAADLLTGSLGDLRVLLANSCAFLDVTGR